MLLASVVGIVVVPFALAAIAAGWVLGKVAVARWIGAGLVAQDEPDDRLQSWRSLGLGFVTIVLSYMIPVLGIAAWALTGVFGVGTATLTLGFGFWWIQFDRNPERQAWHDSIAGTLVVKVPREWPVA
ncbi:MAG: hypothetical protein ABI652_03280 [Acidobacteriota bacterium]